MLLSSRSCESSTHFTNQDNKAHSTLIDHEFWVTCFFPHWATSRQAPFMVAAPSRVVSTASWAPGNPPGNTHPSPSPTEIPSPQHTDRWWPRTWRERPHRQVRVLREREANATKQQHSEPMGLQPTNRVPRKTESAEASGPP